LVSIPLLPEGNFFVPYSWHIQFIFAGMYTLKKSLGQHFLKDENICKRIVAALEQCSFENLLEIGPGAGALTKYLVKLPASNFKAVELDAEKVAYLVTNLPEIKGKIINENFLDVNKPFEGNFTIVGNFPYNISTQILFKVLEWKDDVQCMVGMFQKEVAQRISAKEGSKVYGISSVLTQAFFDVEYLFEVNEGAFQPPPKVKSAVLRMKRKSMHIPMKSEENFFLLVKTAFNQRRKTLRNAVRKLFDKQTLTQKIFDKRAEQLSIDNFAALSFKMLS
jgi:16S rRNA (adenine1518-N6/adenine1519-N6)-dimethyltransferase